MQISKASNTQGINISTMWHGRAALVRPRLCRWRAAGARKKSSRQMRDAARRTGPPRRCVLARTSIPRCVRLQRRQVAAGGLVCSVRGRRGAGAGPVRRWCAGPVQAVRGARRGGAARAAVAPSRRPARVALPISHSRSVHRGLRSRYRWQEYSRRHSSHSTSGRSDREHICTFIHHIKSFHAIH